MRMIAGKRYYGEDVHVEEARHFQDIIGKIFELGATSNPIDFLPLLRWIDYGAFGLPRNQLATLWFEERPSSHHHKKEAASIASIDGGGASDLDFQGYN
ncbi:hypothetical protein AAG906_023901 [Vitis piasezkii]